MTQSAANAVTSHSTARITDSACSSATSGITKRPERNTIGRNRSARCESMPTRDKGEQGRRVVSAGRPASCRR